MASPQWSPLSSSFWTLQGIGWGTYGLLWYLASLPVYYGAASEALLIGAARTAYYVLLGIGATLLLRPLYRYLWSRQASLARLLAASVVCSFVGSILWLLCFEAVKWPLRSAPFSGAYGASSLLYFARPVVSNTFVLLAWSGLYFGIKHQRGLLAQQERTLRAETLAREAQIQMLRYQLNPHFLFNTLNTLLTLIGEDDRRAKQFVHQLAEFLRYSLLGTDTQTVPLQEEVAVIRSFLSIERLRFGDDLQVDIDVASASRTAPVPPFVVQSLVENAVKHGRASGTTPLRVRLRTQMENDRLTIEVANTGRLRPAARDNRTGIGLRNLRERLDKLYPGRYEFTLRADDGWVRARLVLTPPPIPDSAPAAAAARG
jgi:signal transduction histidine kinase